jgi:glycosyltransferase involved in cell wall biosynthesis
LSRIVSILPKGEGFSPQRFGAVSLCVRDFTLHSAYRADTTVIGTVPGPHFEGVQYVALPQVRWYENRTRSYARQCAQVIRAARAELVEVHNRPNLIRLIGPKVRAKLALHLHNDPQEMDHTRTPRERRALLESVCAVYCVSDYIRARFNDGLETALHSKVHLVYNGIAVPEAVPQKENSIVFAGRMTEGKGALLLAEALRIALPRLPEWRAVLIGSGRHAVAETPGEHEQKVAQMLTPLGAQATLTGFLSHEETLMHFSRAAIAVVPSVWQEPFGRTALEAMAYGCAVISSGRGGLREVTQDAAFTLDTLTPQAIADAILMLAQDPQQRERLQQLARARADAFSIARCTMMLDAARDRIFAGGNAHAA